MKDIIKKECTSQINNDCFIKSLTNLIKNEVSIAIAHSNGNNNDVQPNLTPCTNEQKVNDVLFDTLKNEITFLRNEMSSKNKIIELLIAEQNPNVRKVIDNTNKLNKSKVNHEQNANVNESVNKNVTERSDDFNVYIHKNINKKSKDLRS